MKTANQFAEYDFNTAFPEETNSAPTRFPRACGGGGDLSLPAPRGEVPAQQAEGSCPLPRASGGGADEVGGGGLTPNPNPQSLTPDPPLPPLTDALLEDLVNPSISVFDLCNDHELSLKQLDAIINSEQFHRAKRTIESVSRARRELMQPEAETLALARMTDLLKDRPENERHAETVRKVATQILRAAAKDASNQRTPTPDQREAPPTSCRKSTKKPRPKDAAHGTHAHPNSDLRPLALHQSHHKRDQEQHHEQEEQDHRNVRQALRDAPETKDRRDDRDNKENDSPSQHDSFLSKSPDNPGYAPAYRTAAAVTPQNRVNLSSPTATEPNMSPDEPFAFATRTPTCSTHPAGSSPSSDHERAHR